MDTKQIKSLMDDFDNSGLSKIKIKKDNFSLEMEKYTAPAPAAPTVVHAVAPHMGEVAHAAPQEALKAPKEEKEKVQIDADALHIKSPMVGTFYAAPSPTSSSFVKVGDVVNKGQTVAIVEAMKIMNEIEAEFECKIVDILVKDGQIVEYEMPLFVVEKL